MTRLKNFLFPLTGCWVGLIFTPHWSEASVGEFSVDSSSFMRSADNRGVSMTTIAVKADFDSRRAVVDSRLNVTLNTFAEKPNSVTPQIYDAYVALNENVLPGNQVTLGRRRMDWGHGDEVWELGLWSPRFLWDPTRPEKLGLTGLFYTFESGDFKAQAFASPISEPERGAPLTTENGKFVAASPFTAAFPAAVDVEGAVAPIKYELDFPPINELLVNFGTAIAFQYRPSQGFWGGLSYGLLPIHQAEILVDTKLSTANFELEARIVPRIRHHHLAQSELGYRTGPAHFWVSAAGEYPVKVSTASDFIRNPVGPALIMMGGVDLSYRSLTVNASYLRIKEDTAKDKVESEFDITVPSRFSYTRALKTAATLDTGSRFIYHASATHDFPQRSTMLTAELRFLPGRHRGAHHVANRWRLDLGTDWFISETGEGWFGQYRGNDRVRGKISYAF